MVFSEKNRYLESIIVSLIGVILLLTEDFGAWQDRDSFYGYVESYVWIGSTKNFPISQIVIISISICLLYLAYISYQGYTQSESFSQTQLINAFRVTKIELGITTVSTILFVVEAMSWDWWWLGPGFYGAIIAGIVNWWVYKQLT